MSADAKIDPHDQARLDVLALVGSRESLSPKPDWERIGKLAADHRLEPHLHGRLSRGEVDADFVPAAIRGKWAAAHRQSALHGLVQRAALLEASELLAQKGIGSIALKGSWLAWNAFPNAAERVMRDIDLLVPSDQAIRAYQTLLDAGWSGPDVHQRTFAPLIEREAHLPPLISPEGVYCELHTRLWAEREGMPVGIAETVCARCRAEPEHPALRLPDPQDTLIHLCVHAAYSHRFDVGPLLLSDIDYLTAARPIEWPSFWKEADRIGALRGAATCIALVDRWRRPDLLEKSNCPITIPDDLLSTATLLLVADSEARQDAPLIAALKAGYDDAGMTGAVNVARQRSAADPRNLVQGEGSLLDRPRRAVSALGALANKSTRGTATRLQTLNEYLRKD